MDSLRSRLLNKALYLGVTFLVFWVGRALAEAVERSLASSPGLAFAALFGLAIACLLLGYGVEQPLLWKRRFEPKADEIRWIGSQHPQLVGAAPPPIALGLALGFLLTALV